MDENKEQTKSIEKLTKAMQRSNSLGWMFLKGIFYSMGWIVGLALIAMVLYYILPKTGEGNILGRFVHAMSDAIRPK
jgi:hypothetical protein